MNDELEPCIGCGALVPRSDGPTHPYIGASPGCWAVFGEVLAKQYGEYRYPAVHRLTVDAYAVQHPGTPSRKSIQSVAVHLVSMYLVLERGFDARRATAAMRRVLAAGRAFTWLEPPELWGGLTILDVREAQGLEEHTARVRRWARSVWEAWADYHEVVREWATLEAL